MTKYDGLFESAIAQYGLFEGEDHRLATMRGWAHVESALDPWALRMEPRFYMHYTRPLHETDTEEYSRAMSWGLFQVMGQVARENGFDGDYLSELCSPVINVDLAGKILRHNYDIIGEWDGALAAYNGGLGGNRRRPYRRQVYADKVRQAALTFRG